MEITCNSINSNLFSLEAHVSGVISVWPIFGEGANLMQNAGILLILIW